MNRKLEGCRSNAGVTTGDRVTAFAIGYVFAMVLLAALVLLVADRVRQWSTHVPPEEQVVHAAEHDARLRNPRWKELEAHFGVPAAPKLRALYSSEFVLRENLTFAFPSKDGSTDEEHLSAFCPADVRGVSDAATVVTDGSFPLAEDGMGNFFSVAFGTGESVRFHMHDGGESWDISPNLDAFLSGIRECQKAAFKADAADNREPA